MGGTILEFRHDFYEILQVDKKASLEVLSLMPDTKMRDIAKIGIEPIIPSVELASGARIEVEGSSCPLSLYSLI